MIGIHKFSIITPCYNAEKYIAETMKSVFLQTELYNTKSELEYIIIDGNSNDSTIEIIESNIKLYRKSNIYVKFVSEKDNGMYDALAKGLNLVTGDICAYINADDFYNLQAFSVLSEVFEMENIKWITGIQTTYNSKSQIVSAYLPYIYRNNFIEKGIYGRYLPWIQQESTFWKNELNPCIDVSKLSKLKYAGDFYLWRCFSQKATLNIIQAILAGFRIREGQLSEDLSGYMKEMDLLVLGNPGLMDLVHVLLDRIKGTRPTYFNKNIIKYNHKLLKWS